MGEMKDSVDCVMQMMGELSKQQPESLILRQKNL